MWSRRPIRAARRRRACVDTLDAGSFPSAARRVRVFRSVFGGAAVALVVAAVAHARDLDAREPGLVPNGATGVAVVDLSLSITDEDYATARAAFRRLIAENASIGLVIFSDVAYELLPPGTPASELRPMLRLLVPSGAGPPVNPWTETFRSGTRVSTALQLARTMLERDGIRGGSILLVSDLETAPDDVPALTRTVESLRQSPIELRVVGLSPSSDARLIFGESLENGVFAVSPAGRLVPAGKSEAGIGLPTKLLLLAALSLLALTAHERLGGSLAITGGEWSMSSARGRA